MKLERLSVLDQSPAHDGKGEASGLHDTVKLAQQCEQWGYHRYWCAEHHDTPGYSSPCPEIMVAHIACATDRIRVGSGGVMLTHYSPFKVAETFRMLEALHPGRIDLGIGRAPGGNQRVSHALASPRDLISHELYPRQSYELAGHLEGSLPDDHPFAATRVVPEDGGVPKRWMLGSAGGSAELAGHLGSGFVLALFIGTHERSPAIIDAYKAAFVPSQSHATQQSMIAVAVICGETKAQAEMIASSHTYWKVQAFRHGRHDALKTPEHALKAYERLSEDDKAYYRETLDSYVLGTAEECIDELQEITETFGVDEIMVVNVTYSFTHRQRTYELLAEAAQRRGLI